MSNHDMALLLEGDSMTVDGAMQGLEGIEGMQGIQGMEGMEGMEGMGSMGSMGSAMALDEVDLFGDPVMDDALAGLPSQALPSKSLLQRIDELRTRGCCQGIAWSRQGTIATIAKDAMSVELRFIRSHPDTTEWGLSEPSSWSPPSPVASPPAPNPPTPISLASSSAPFVHLAWSPTMSPDLAVIDALGRLTILSFSIANNLPYPARRWETDAADDLHAIVGCYWLPQGMAPNKQVSRSRCTLYRKCLFTNPLLKSFTSSTARLPRASPSIDMSINSSRPRAPGTRTRPRVPSCASQRMAPSNSSSHKTTAGQKKRPSNSRA
jgi:mediator of RNA polymerase II transcription subunit 16